MAGVLRWRKRNCLTQVDAARLLGISQPYWSLLEKGARPLTAELRNRMKTCAGQQKQSTPDALLRAQLSALGYPGFAHLAKPRTRTRTRPDQLLIKVLAKPDVDARIVEALPWLAAAFQNQFDFRSLVHQAKQQNLQNRLGFVLQIAAADSPSGVLALRELERARLLQEDTLCWDSMPLATREWMRSNRTPLAKHWNVLTRLRVEDDYHAP